MAMVSWVLAGALAGLLAGRANRVQGSRLLMDAVVGMAGAFTGGLAANLLLQTQATAFNLPSLLAAAMLSLLFLGAVQLSQKGKT